MIALPYDYFLIAWFVIAVAWFFRCLYNLFDIQRGGDGAFHAKKMEITFDLHEWEHPWLYPFLSYWFLSKLKMPPGSFLGGIKEIALSDRD